MLARLAALLALLVLAGPGRADTLLRLEDAPQQGALMRGTTMPGAQVTLDGRALRVGPDGRFLFGFGRDHGPTAQLSATLPDGRRQALDIAVARRDYKVQRIDGLPGAMVSPPAETLERIRREQAQIAATRRVDSAEPWFQAGFIWPVQGIISGVYGSQRILNGEPRMPHLGIDIAAPVGTPVRASTGGKVLLAEPDLYFNGGTLIIDHGYGLTGTYSHLSEILVQVGQEVRQGDIVARVGATGRVTGAHLDWRLNWFDRPLDPALLMGPMPPG